VALYRQALKWHSAQSYFYLQPIAKLYWFTNELKLRDDFRCFRSKKCASARLAQCHWTALLTLHFYNWVELAICCGSLSNSCGALVDSGTLSTEPSRRVTTRWLDGRSSCIVSCFPDGAPGTTTPFWRGRRNANSFTNNLSDRLVIRVSRLQWAERAIEVN